MAGTLSYGLKTDRDHVDQTQLGAPLSVDLWACPICAVCVIDTISVGLQAIRDSAF